MKEGGVIVVSTTILCKNYKNTYDRKKNPSPDDCYGLIKITYSKKDVTLARSRLEFTCEECYQKELKEKI
jgi:hypothetical protein